MAVCWGCAGEFARQRRLLQVAARRKQRGGDSKTTGGAARTKGRGAWPARGPGCWLLMWPLLRRGGVALLGAWRGLVQSEGVVVERFKFRRQQGRSATSGSAWKSERRLLRRLGVVLCCLSGGVASGTAWKGGAAALYGAGFGYLGGGPIDWYGVRPWGRCVRRSGGSLWCGFRLLGWRSRRPVWGATSGSARGGWWIRWRHGVEVHELDPGESLVFGGGSRSQ